jgi:hypothetical protein
MLGGTTRTVNTQLQKDQSIVRLLDGLRARLGLRSFDVVDHWEGDSCAIGIARPDNHSVLVYISTSGEPGERCSVSLELPPQPGSDIPYTAAGDHDAASLDELAEIVRRHFQYDRAA